MVPAHLWLGCVPILPLAAKCVAVFSNMKISPTQQMKITRKVDYLVERTIEMTVEEAKQLNLTTYEGITLASIKNQLNNKYRLSINQASFVSELYKRLKPKSGLHLEKSE